MATNQVTIIKENSSGDFQELKVTAEANKAIGFDTNLNPVMVSVSGGGGFTIEQNGSALPERSQLNIVGKNLFSSDANENKMLLFQELPKDMRFEFTNHAMLDCIWRHTDGYWYIVGNVYRDDVNNYYVYTDKIRVLKTLDWMTFETVFEASKGTNRSAEYPRLVVDSDGNVFVIARKNASAPNAVTCYFYNANNQTVTLTDIQVSIATTTFAMLDSIAIKPDGTVGVAGFAWEPGNYDKLFYIERSPGVDGVWSAKESIGANGLRAIVATSCIHLFYGSDGEPRIVFLNNASATSSKISVAKKQSGTWTVYESTLTTAYQATIAANNDLWIGNANTYPTIFNDSNNSFEMGLNCGLTAMSVASTTNNVFVGNMPLNADISISSANQTSLAIAKYTSTTVIAAMKYFKSSFMFQRFGALPFSPAPSFILYNHQRLDNAYALMFRMDGSMFMEAVSW